MGSMNEAEARIIEHNSYVHKYFQKHVSVFTIQQRMLIKWH
jgi:hypothetical protein